MDPSQLQKIRPCGRHESYSTARHHLGFYNNIGLTAHYTTTSALGIPIEGLVFAALRHVIAEHPNLSTIAINEEQSSPDVYFARLPDIDLRTCVEFRNREQPIPQDEECDHELDQILREQHSRNFKSNDYSRPHWRLVIVSSPEQPERFSASWFVHHALTDGASSMIFHESLLKNLNAAQIQADISPIVQSPSSSLSPPLEELHPMTISWAFFLRAIAGSVMPSYFAPRPQGLWTGLPVGSINQTPVRSHNVTVILSAETTKAFAQKCRRERTSVTAALSTLLAAVLFRNIHRHNELRIGTPISLRPFLAAPKDQMVNAITNHIFTFNRTGGSNRSLNDSFSWDKARAVKDGLVKEVEIRGAENPVALLKYVSNIHEHFLEKLGKPRDTSAEVSNLGVWRPNHSLSVEDNKKTWSLGRVIFSQSMNHTGAQISLNAVTGGDGCLVLSHTWPQETAQSETDGGVNSLHLVPEMMKSGIKALVEEEEQEQ